MKTLIGACLCGDVSIAVALPQAPDISACHCGTCQSWTGSAFFCFPAPADAVTAKGPIQYYRSSPFSQRAFCGRCGTHLWMKDDDGDFDIVPGLFPQLRDAPLHHEIYADRSLGSVRLAGHHPRISAADYEANHPHLEGCG